MYSWARVTLRIGVCDTGDWCHMAAALIMPPDHVACWMVNGSRTDLTLALLQVSADHRRHAESSTV
jgi:hypothetical protein